MTVPDKTEQRPSYTLSRNKFLRIIASAGVIGSCGALLQESTSNSHAKWYEDRKRAIDAWENTKTELYNKSGDFYISQMLLYSKERVRSATAPIITKESRTRTIRGVRYTVVNQIDNQNNRYATVIASHGQLRPDFADAKKITVYLPTGNGLDTDTALFSSTFKNFWINRGVAIFPVLRGDKFTLSDNDVADSLQNFFDSCANDVYKPLDQILKDFPELSKIPMKIVGISQGATVYGGISPWQNLYACSPHITRADIFAPIQTVYNEESMHTLLTSDPVERIIGIVDYQRYLIRSLYQRFYPYDKQNTFFQLERLLSQSEQKTQLFKQFLRISPEFNLRASQSCNGLTLPQHPLTVRLASFDEAIPVSESNKFIQDRKKAVPIDTKVYPGAHEVFIPLMLNDPDVLF